MGSTRIRPIELIVGIGGSIAVLAVLLAKPPGGRRSRSSSRRSCRPASSCTGRRPRAGRATAEAAVARDAPPAREPRPRGRGARPVAGRAPGPARRSSSRSTRSPPRSARRSTSRSCSTRRSRRSSATCRSTGRWSCSSTTRPASSADGRSIGGGPEAQALVGEVRLPLDEERATLVQLARADGPLVFRDVHEDAYEPNRAFARALDVTSFLGTPLATKGRTVGVLAVDNRLSGRDVERSMGPLLYTVGNLLAEAVENARLYAQIEEQNRELEARVAHADGPARRGDPGGAGGAGDGGGGERDEERVPRQRQPRAADAADLGRRLHEDRPEAARRGRRCRRSSARARRPQRPTTRSSTGRSARSATTSRSSSPRATG